MKTFLKYLLVFIIAEALSSSHTYIEASLQNQNEQHGSQKLGPKLAQASSQNTTYKLLELSSKKQKFLSSKRKRSTAKLAAIKRTTKVSKPEFKNNSNNFNRKIANAAEHVANHLNYSQRCKNEFISSDGLGEWGRFINRELSKKSYENLLTNNKAFKKFCPGFRNMNKQDKKNLWVFILMSMSHYESSCRYNAEAQGPNGIAKGLLQLHSGAENRYAMWDQNRICRRGDSKNPIESLQCALSMLDGQIEKHNSIFYEGSYWDVLRKSSEPETHASKIKKALEMIPGCGPKSIASDKHDDGRSRG